MYERIDTGHGWETRLRCACCHTIGAVVAGVGKKAEKIARQRKPIGWGHIRERGKVTSLYGCPDCLRAARTASA